MVNSPTFVGRARHLESRFWGDLAAHRGFGTADAFPRRWKPL